MALNPASRKASSNEKLVSLSAVQPKTFPPRTSGAMSRFVVPSLRICIGVYLQLLAEAPAHFGQKFRDELAREKPTLPIISRATCVQPHQRAQSWSHWRFPVSERGAPTTACP